MDVEVEKAIKLLNKIKRPHENELCPQWWIKKEILDYVDQALAELSKPKCMTCNDTGVVCDDEDLGGHAVTNNPCPDCKPEPTNICPECGEPDIKTFVDKVNFGTIDIYCPIKECNACGFKWTDNISDEVYEKNKTEIDRLKAEIVRLESELDYSEARNKRLQKRLKVRDEEIDQQAERIKELEQALRESELKI
jgi:hypothetical protein